MVGNPEIVSARHKKRRLLLILDLILKLRRMEYWNDVVLEDWNQRINYCLFRIRYNAYIELRLTKSVYVKRIIKALSQQSLYLSNALRSMFDKVDFIGNK